MNKLISSTDAIIKIAKGEKFDTKPINDNGTFVSVKKDGEEFDLYFSN